MSRTFRLVDVFGQSPLTGNPVAVLDAGEQLDPQTMQQITRWLNLSETTFLLRPTTPEADYKVRIFTLEREMPFAGHPTLGTCHAWLEAGGIPSNPEHIVQECGAGLVTVRRNQAGLAFEAPPLIRSGACDRAKVQEIAHVLRIPAEAIVEAEWVDNGPGWAAVLLASASEVLAIDPLRSYPTRIDIGVVGPYPDDHKSAFELRAFFSDHVGGLVEDPVTGSLNASVAQWLLRTGRATAPYQASQGTRLGRRGRIVIDQSTDGTVWIGGRTETLFTGTVDF